MLRLIGGRIVQSIPVLLAVLVLSFILLRLVPGDPVRLMLGIDARPQSVALVRRQLGLDAPIGSQLLTYITHAVKGNLGTSIIQDAPVSRIIGSRILPTLYLIGGAVFLALLLAVPAAVVSVLHRNGPADHLVRLSSSVAFGMPSFWVGLMLALIVSLKLHLLPSSGYGDTPISVVQTLLLPCLTLGLQMAPILIRTLRSSLIEALGSEFAEAARARGFSTARVVGKHAMRNALVPLVSVLSINVGFLISGTVIVENVFQIPGLGSLLVQSVMARDFPIVQGLVLVFGLMVVITNLMGDLTYSVIDPRVRQ
jgi:peptide/nickel transport system permease protein